MRAITFAKIYKHLPCNVYKPAESSIRRQSVKTSNQPSYTRPSPSTNRATADVELFADRPTRNRNHHSQITAANNDLTKPVQEGSMALLVGAAGFAIDRNRRKKCHQRKAALLENEAWRARINPQFFHSSLQRISKYVTTNEKDLASSYIARFAKLMRDVLENADQREITLAQELDLLREYLELESERLSNSLHLR